jgi:hypothetical protein
MSNTTIAVYGGKLLLTVTDKTFRDAIKYILHDDVLKNYEPLKVILPDTKQTLFFDRHVFSNYLEETISEPELIELCIMEKLYRNTAHLKTDNDVEIDKGSLWRLYQNELILVDDDQYITAELNHLFEEVI